MLPFLFLVYLSPHIPSHHISIHAQVLVLEATRAAGHVQTLNAQISQLQLQLQEARETLVHERAVNAKRQEQQQKQQQEQQPSKQHADGEIGGSASASSSASVSDELASPSAAAAAASPRLKKSKSFFESLGFGSKD